TSASRWWQGDDFRSRALSPVECSHARPEEDRMSLPEITSREEWLVARKQLLQREKERTRAGDALKADRRRLPMVPIDKPYVFQGPQGEASLVDLFEGRRQLIM